MERFTRRRTLYVQRRFYISFIVFLFAFSLAVPALAEFLGPDRTTTQFVTVRDPDNDVWTLTHVDPLDGFADVCLIVHTCDEHPSVGRQASLCGWVADNSGCSMAYKTEEQTVTLAEATIADDLQNCNLNNGWCTSSPTLHLTANEPLLGETITLIEGSRNGEAFACASDTCDVPLVEGNNSFSFWALSSYGDSSQMGNQSAEVDTVPPSSAFGSPPEGSSVWVSGVLNMSGSSSDASSGVASAELSLNGGGSWQGLSLAGNSWGYSWDTSSVPDGSYQVLVRASDIAGHLESTASITVHVDQTAPSANLPDEWLIWEPVAIGASDGGSGVDSVEFTIQGGSFGVRKYQWSGGGVPSNFIWDRFFGITVAPIGEYEVTLTVWDALGNSGSDSGTIMIPAPPTDEPEPTSVPPTEPPATSTPHATATSGAAGFAIVSTATFTASSGGAPAAAPLDDSAAPAALADPETTSPTSGPPGGLLWGGAALAAAAAATAYALSRRRAREAYIEQMRAQIARESSPSDRDRRLRSLRQRAEARIAPLRNALLAAVAARAGKELLDQRRSSMRAQVLNGGATGFEERIGDPVHSNLATWQTSNSELESMHQLGRYYAYQDSSEAFATRYVNLIPDPEAARRAVAIADVGDTLLDVIRYSPLRLAYLETGYIGVRINDLALPASRIGYRANLGLAGTRYLPGSVAGFQLRTLGTTAARGLGISMAGSILTNLVDFEVGAQRNYGVGSPEFYASTMVDFSAAGLSGLAAAGGVALAIGGLTAIGVGAVATAPVWATLVLTAAAGAGIAAMINSATIDGKPALDVLKERVVGGFYAWGGIRQNAGVIVDVVEGRIQETAEQVVHRFRNAATQAAHKVETTAQNIATGIQNTARNTAAWARNTVGDARSIVQSAAAAVGDAIGETVQKVSGFVGGLFGGD